MIEPLIKSLADTLGFDQGDLDAIADTSEETGPVWTLAFDDLICRIEEVQRGDDLLICCLCALDEAKPQEELEQARLFARRLSALPPSAASLKLVYSDESGIFYCFDCKKAGSLSPGDFCNFVLSCAHGALQLIDDNAKPAVLNLEDYDAGKEAQKLKEFIGAGGIDFRLLEQNLMRIGDDESLASVWLDPLNRRIVLSSLVLRDPTEGQVLQSLCANALLPLENTVIFSGDGLTLDTALTPGEPNQNLQDLIALHFARVREYAKALSQSADKAQSDPQELLKQGLTPA